MSYLDKADKLARPGATICSSRYHSSLGPYPVSPDSLQNVLSAIYKQLGAVGCKLGDDVLTPDEKAIEKITKVLQKYSVMIADDPVGICIYPELENDDICCGVSQSDCSNKIIGIKISITGIGRTRHKRAEAAIKRTFGDNHG